MNKNPQFSIAPKEWVPPPGFLRHDEVRSVFSSALTSSMGYQLSQFFGILLIIALFKTEHENYLEIVKFLFKIENLKVREDYVWYVLNTLSNGTVSCLKNELMPKPKTSRKVVNGLYVMVTEQQGPTMRRSLRWDISKEEVHQILSGTTSFILVLPTLKTYIEILAWNEVACVDAVSMHLPRETIECSEVSTHLPCETASK